MEYVWKFLILGLVAELAVRLLSDHVAPRRRPWMLVAVMSVAAAALAAV